jgi:hypothetical protein
MKQVYIISYPTGKIYIGKDSVGSFRYFGSPDMLLVNDDFGRLSEEVRTDYTIRKRILWQSESCTESELAAMEVYFIRKYQANDPTIGYNRWPKFGVPGGQRAAQVSHAAVSYDHAGSPNTGTDATLGNEGDQMRETDYQQELASVRVEFPSGGEGRLERILVKESGLEEIRFSWWKDGRFIPRPLDLPEAELLELLRKGISGGVFTDRFLLELTRVLLQTPLREAPGGS